MSKLLHVGEVIPFRSVLDHLYNDGVRVAGVEALHELDNFQACLAQWHHHL